MKKLLVTLIVSLVFSGSIFAQHPETHWPGFNLYAYETQGALYASIMVFDEPVDVNYPDWDQLEVAAFVGDELRMTAMFLTDEYVIEWGELFPTLNAEPIYYTNPGEVVTFKMYNHATGVEYGECQALIWDGEENVTILTGEEHWEGFDDPDHPLMLNFSAPTFTKDIVGYGDPSNPAGYYLIASPLLNAVKPNGVINMTSNVFDLYYFNQDVDDDLPWINYKDEEGDFDPNFTLVPGKGYLYANSEDVTLTFVGTPYDGDGIINLDYVEGKTFTGWNLIGNPFNETAYLLTEDESDWVDFYILDGTEFRMAEYEESYINPMCGILVEATPDLQAVKFDIDKKSSVKRRALDMTLTQNSGNVRDVARLRFDNGRGLHKFQINPSSTKIYFTMDNEDYAVVNAPEMGEMPVSFKAENNGTYTMSFTGQEVNFNYLHLIDNMTGADVDLLVNPSYSFDATTSDYASRFKLVFATGNNSDDNFAFFNNGNFIISNDGEAVLQVIDVTGRILNSNTINGSASVNVNAAPGVYMLRLINGDNVKVQKVVVE